MSSSVLIEIIRGAVALLGIILTLWLTNRFNKLKHHINSRMDELLKLHSDKARAEGNLEGRAEQKQETKTT